MTTTARPIPAPERRWQAELAKLARSAAARGGRPRRWRLPGPGPGARRRRVAAISAVLT